MLRFIVRRSLGALAGIFAASIVIFIGCQLLPGNAASVVLGRNGDPAAVTALNKSLNLDKPVVQQYTDWLRGFVHGDLGDSAVGLAQGAQHAPIWPLISNPVKNSVILALVTALLMIPLSLVLGVLAAVYAGRWLDNVISIGSLAAISLPEFVIGVAARRRLLRRLRPVAAGRDRGAGRQPARQPDQADPAGRDAAARKPRRGHPHGARGHARGAADRVRADGAPERHRRAEGAAPLRAAQRARAERADPRPEPAVADRRDHHHRERLRLPRHRLDARGRGAEPRRDGGAVGRDAASRSSTSCSTCWPT